MIDTHAHLDALQGPDAALARAAAVGVTGVVTVGTGIDSCRAAVALADAHEGVHAALGIDPHQALSREAGRVDELRSLLAHPKTVAVGEAGLDYHYGRDSRVQQRRLFGAQLELAGELGLPVVVHTREAEDDTHAFVTEAGHAGVRGVLHCFTGSAALAEAALGVGWYVSFSGIVTFKKWTDLALLRLVPDDRLLVESDAPYLAPVPHRGRRNEPAWVAHTVERLAVVREADADALGERVVRNARRFFGLADGSAAR